MPLIHPSKNVNTMAVPSTKLGTKSFSMKAGGRTWVTMISRDISKKKKIDNMPKVISFLNPPTAVCR